MKFKSTPSQSYTNHRIVVSALLAYALCISVTSEAFAAFSDVQQSQTGYNNFFSGNTRVTSGTLTNSGSLSASFSALTASTGSIWGWDTFVNGGNPTKSGNYFYGLGVLAWNPNVSANGTTTITNNAGAKMQGIVTGSGKAFAAGLYSIQFGGGTSTVDITVNNSGTMDGQVLNNDGTAAGCLNLSSAGGGIVNNKSGATCSATAKYYSTGIINQCFGGLATVVNNGAVKSTSTGSSASTAFTCGVDVFTFGTNVPASFNNTGTVTSSTTAGTTQKAYGGFIWAQGGTMTFKNSGTITASGLHCEAVYCGSKGGNDSFTNSGTITATAGSGGGWAVGCENDSVGQNFTITNSGRISTNNGYGLFVQGFGTQTNGQLTITNTSTGTISGSLGIGTSHWFGPATIDNSGAVSGPINTSTSGATVFMRGAATCTGTIKGNGGTNKLIFSLSGTLQSVNGATATKGGNLANYSLGTSGNIVVSGHTYTWSNYTVSGSTAN